MLRNYFKIAWRNFIKNGAYSFINLSGLTIGLTCFILIALYIQYELSYDLQHKNVDNIYRIVQQQKGNEYQGSDMMVPTPLPLGKSLKEDFPEVLAITNLNVWGALLIKDKESFPQRGLLSDKHIFDVFTIPVIEGEGKEALDDPNSILLTASLAKKIFGDISPIGQTLVYNSTETVEVKGLIADPPKNQHFSYDYIVSAKIWPQYEHDVGRWNSNNYRTYMVLAEGTDINAFEEKMKVYENITKPIYQQSNFEFFPEYKLQPLKSIHLYSNINHEIEANGDIKYVYLFAFIGFIILILASINYTNLTTARSLQRVKEIGVSKVMGASKLQLIGQFLGEAIMFTVISFIIALVLVLLVLPTYNELIGKNISFSIFNNSELILAMFSIAIVVGVLSGLYPALFLSKLNPGNALKNNILKGPQRVTGVRNVLVTGQFVVAITLAIGSIIIYQQLHFIQHKHLGFNKDRVVHVGYGSKEIYENESVIRSELLSHPKIQKVAFSNRLPFGINSYGNIDRWEGNPGNKQLNLYRSYVDYDFIDLFEMELLEGRNFSPKFPTDTLEAYILNESAVKALGWETAVGKSFDEGRVIGVIKDFHSQTFDQKIEPLFMAMRRPYNRHYGQAIVKINGDDFLETKAFIEKTMKSVVPLAPYEAKFVNESYNVQYKTEQKLGQAFNLFTLLALFIASMGLFGLVSFTVIQRTKEIGIRKVLGASITRIVGLLSVDFIKLVLLALIISIPIAYYVMNKWLMNFAYKIDVNWWVFIIVGIIVIVIAFVTISFQSIKAAIVNPIKSLKTE